MSQPTKRYSIVEIATIGMNRLNDSCKPTLDNILKECCDIFNQSIFNIQFGPKTGDIVKVRRLFCYAASVLTDASLLNISKMIGGHEHTKALHHIQKIKGWIKVKDPDFLLEWEQYTSNSQIWQNNAK